jgi:DNA primase
MIDTQRLKETCDLRRLVAGDLGPAPVHGGRAHLWKCPFHHEQKGYSLAVWVNGYRCFGRCDTAGDAIDWLVNYRRLSFAEAVRVLGEPLPAPAPPTERQPERAHAEPPDWRWQQRAGQVVSLAEDTLWSSAGEAALGYLLTRGLTAETIRQARLGYIPGDYREQRTLAGLEVPCGITIPWLAFDVLWAVKVRRAAGLPKYLQIAGGSAAGLYGADALEKADVALFCEGEFDALLVGQEAGSLVTAVTLGSAVNPLAARWLGELIHCRLLLVAYDHDEAGRRGARRLRKISPRFHAITVPHGNDIGDFFLNGGDIYAWIDEQLHLLLAMPERLTDAL